MLGFKLLASLEIFFKDYKPKQMLKIIHLSDFHLESDKPTFDRQQLIKALILDLEISANIDKNTILVISGDLIDKGGLNFSKTNCPFEYFENFFIKKLLAKFPQLENKLFIVPGNHDIERNGTFKFTKNGLLQAIKQNYEYETNTLISEHRTTNNFNPQISKYKKFEKEFYRNYPNSQWSNFDFSKKITLGDNNIGISCLNSSWLCYDENDFGNLVLGKSQIENSLGFIEDTDFKISIFHHPLEFFIEEDKNVIKPYSNEQ